MKRFIQSALNSFGYRIEKLRPPSPNEYAYLDLALYILNQRRDGMVRFIQIGANDGLQDDPCYEWLRRYPWQGILVEPQPKVADRLRKIYRDRENIVIEQAAIADHSGQKDFYYLTEHPNAPAWASDIGSFDYPSIIARRHKIPKFDASFRKMSVSAYTLDDLLDRYHINTLDFLQVDAGTYDGRILASIDFRRVKPAIIAYEDDNLSSDERATSHARLTGEGYRFATWYGQTVACLSEILPIWNERIARFGRDARAVRRRYGDCVRFVKPLNSAKESDRWLVTQEDRPRLTIVVTTYQQELALDCLLKSLICQTLQNFKVLVIHDGPSAATRSIVDPYSRDRPAMFEYLETANRVNDYGHSLRAIGIDRTSTEFVLLTNGDNYYVPRFVEFMFEAIDRNSLDLVFCDMIHSHPGAGCSAQLSYEVFHTRPLRRFIDIGCFIARSDAAKKVGFRDRSFTADATYFEDLLSASRTVVVGKVDKVLMVHN
jgi:FkbM family methyltransferase